MEALKQAGNIAATAPQAGGEVIVGQRVVLRGTLTAAGTVRIEGQLSGRLSSEGKVVVGPSAVVEADVSAREVAVGGRLQGEVRATESIEIQPTAHVSGSLEAPEVAIHKGASYDGHCHTRKPGAKAERGPAGARSPTK